jgi:oligopeptidase B
MTESPMPPVAARRPVTAVHHGVTLTDDYAWLRQSNWQEMMRDPSLLDPDIRAYLEAENAHTATILKPTEALQEALYAEMRARIKEDDSSPPTPDGPFAYYTSFITGGQYARLCRIPRDGGPETIILDGNREGEDKAYWSLGAAAHSPDHALLAFATDDKGSEIYTLRIREMATGQELPDVIEGTRGGLVWAADSRTLFYVRIDEQQRPRWIMRHMLGADPASDVVVYEEPDAGFFTGVGKSQSGDWIIISSHDHQTSDARLIDAHDPTSAPRLVAPRTPGHEYSVEHATGPDRLIINTNSAGAIDFRICEAPIPATGTEGRIDDWREIEPHREGRLIIDVDVLKGHLIRLERENSLPRIVIRRLGDGLEHSIGFAEEAYALGLSTGYEFDTTAVRFTYQSMTTPAETYDYDVETRARVLRKRQEVPSGHEPSDYITRRILAPARDGAEVPVTLLYRKSTTLDGTAPLMLYGYGSYGIAMPASFSTGRLSLVDRGFIYAIAHIRGGMDKGYGWYTAGKREHKLNTFHDFIDSGRHLAKMGFTREGRIVANGGSAGGMLMGAVANMAPDLFLGILADVPFVDVLNTMLDKDLPLTPPEWPEWGNPLESAEDFARIRSYSPYDNVGTKAYPAMLVHAGLTDPRVTYWEPAKWVAKLREVKTDRNELLLKTNMGAGHGGASGRFEALRESARRYAFALMIAGKA